MSSCPTITVTGTSTLSHVAERGVATLIVSSESTSQEEVATNVRSASASLKELLTSLTPKDPSGASSPDAPITHWSNSSLSTSSYMVPVNQEDPDDRRTERRHTARMSFEVKFQDFERLGDVATRLSTMEHVSIQGIDWRLTSETKDRLGALGRGNAVRDAVRRARDYLEAMEGASVLSEGEGGKEVKVREVVEGHSTAGSRGMMSYHMATQQSYAMCSRGGSAQEGIEFTPEDVQLSSEIAFEFEVVSAVARN